MRRVLLGALTCLAAFFATGCSGTTPVEEETDATTRPNIIFLLMEDLNFATVQRMPELRSSVITSLRCSARAAVSWDGGASAVGAPGAWLDITCGIHPAR